MKLYQAIDCFVHSTSHSSLFSVWEQTKTCSYRELTDFFKKEYLSQDLILSSENIDIDFKDGYLEFDEIVISKSKRGITNFVKKRYKSAGGYVVPGISIVLLVWTDGKIRLPIRFRLQINGEKHTESALWLLSWFRNKISRKIKFVLFDSVFACEKVLKRIDDYGWCFVTRIPKTRVFNNQKITKTHRGGYWTKVGILKCGLKVKAIRKKDKFFITNRVTLTSKQVIDMYSKRAMIEEIFRALKQECHWSRCQLRQHEHYENYYTIGIMAFLFLDKLKIQGLSHSIYNIRKNILFGNFSHISSLHYCYNFTSQWLQISAMLPSLKKM